ncbi:MAG TPA: sulfatase [Gemmataceae bacterium]|nr:sulfatase [Gemmataceae bacterium]
MSRHLLTIVTAAFLLGWAAGPAGAEPAKPNILVILSDDHSVPHLGCYGNPDIKTPNIDKFAAEAMRFDRYYVSCPQCVPSRATLMTGRSPIAVQMTRFSAPLPAEYKVYPEILKEKAGYFAGVAGRTYHLDGVATAPESRAVFEKYDLQTFPKRLDFVKTGGRAQMLPQFREFLDLVPKDRPFVLQLCSNDPHRPLDANAIPEPHDPAKLKLPAHYPDTKLVREDFARYYDEISRFDSDVGTILEELKKRGLAENTIVFVSGDNGASQFRGKGTLYEYGIHVPLLVRWPGKVKPNATTAELVSGEDWAPTLLEAGGVQPPREMTGRSFLKLLKGEPFEGRKHVFAERGAHGSGLPTGTSPFDLARCIVSKKYKLVYNVLWQLPYEPVDFNGTPMWKELVQMNKDGQLSAEMSKLYFSPTRPMFELFDLESDPAEMTNLVGKKETVAVETELKAALQEWMILERDFVPLPVPPPPPRMPME